MRDLESMHTYIASDNPGAAEVTVEAIVAGIEALVRHPEMGRKGRIAGTRELVITPYVTAYCVRTTAIDILAVIHGARRWPDSF